MKTVQCQPRRLNRAAQGQFIGYTNRIQPQRHQSYPTISNHRIEHAPDLEISGVWGLNICLAYAILCYIYMQGIYILYIYISDITFGETSSRRRGSFRFPASSPQAICHTSAVRHQVLRGTRQKPGETTQSERNECIDFRLPSGELK